MLNCKSLVYSMVKLVLLVKNNATIMIEGQFNKHNFYYITLNNSMITTFIWNRIKVALTSKFSTDIII